MKSKVSNLQLLNNTEHRVKFKAGSDIDNVNDSIVGEMLVETSRQSDIFFDGQSKIDTDYIFGGGEISLSAWVKTTNNKDFIIATDSPSGGNDTSFAIGLDDSDKAYIIVGNPGHEIYKTGSVTAINDGNWHNIIVTIDGSKVMNFYIDGALEVTHTFPILPGPSNYVTHYGSGWSDGTEPLYDIWGLDGQLNGLGIWERALTDTEINIISSSGRYSPAPSHFSPNLWVGSTDPALYTCTNTSGTISKVTDLTAKMGDVPMLRTNSNELIPNAVSPFSGGFSYSFWFYDDVAQETGVELLIYNDVDSELGGGSHNSYVAINYSLSRIDFREHISRGNVTFHNDLIANYGTGNEINFKYEKNKLNHILITKEATSPFLTKFYFNNELVAECNPNVGYYPGGNGLQKINSTVLLIGDLAYWDTDISSISDEVHSPNEGHKGFQGDWRNLSIPPKHYWKFGAPMDSGQVKDLGTDGTNHFAPDTVSSNQYEYKNIFGIDRSLEV